MSLLPFGLYCSACFGSLFVSILCTCCSHFSWYCFISFTMFSAPVFCLIHWFFSLSSFVIPSKCRYGNIEVLLLLFFSYRSVQCLLLMHHFCTSKLRLSNKNLFSLRRILAVFETQILFHKWCSDTFVTYLSTELHKPGLSGSFVETTKKEAKEIVCTAALFLPYVRVRCSLQPFSY
jgi:hypothetical protein